MFVHRVTYDATPLKVTVTWGQQRYGPEVGKIFVLQSSWALLVEEQVFRTGMNDENEHDDVMSKFILYRGVCSPQMRATDTNRGEAVACVLRSCNMMPALLDDSQSFITERVRLVETDSHGANERGERLYDAFNNTGWERLSVPCVAHRVHLAAERTLSLGVAWLKGATRALLVIWQSNYMSSIREALESLVRERCECKLAASHSLSTEAKRYRQRVLSLFLPSVKTSRKRARAIWLFATVWNGDWRQDGKLVHICKGAECCPRGHLDTVDLMIRAVPALLKVLRPAALNRANWLDWHRPFQFLGIMSSMHSLLRALYQRAFAKQAGFCIPPSDHTHPKPTKVVLEPVFVGRG